MEVQEAVGNGGWVDSRGDFHAAGGYIAKEIPPFRVICEGWIGDPSDEAGNVEKVVDFCEIGVGESVSCEATEDGSGCKSAGGEDGFGDITAGAVVSKEDDAFLSDEGVEEDNDGMRVGTGCSEVRVKRKWLR